MTYSLLGIIEFLLLPSHSLVLANIDIDVVDLLVVGRVLGGVSSEIWYLRIHQRLTLNRF